MWMAKERAKKSIENTQQVDRIRQQQQPQKATSVDQRILKTALMQAANSTPYNNNASNNASIDVVSIRPKSYFSFLQNFY